MRGVTQLMYTKEIVNVVRKKKKLPPSLNKIEGFWMGEWNERDETWSRTVAPLLLITQTDKTDFPQGLLQRRSPIGCTYGKDDGCTFCGGQRDGSSQNWTRRSASYLRSK